jgi:hypothetical protein
VRKILLLVALCLVGVLVISSAAFAQSTYASSSASASATMGASASASASAGATASASALPPSGGPTVSSLLSVTAGVMLLGSGIVSLALTRRRS